MQLTWAFFMPALTVKASAGILLLDPTPEAAVLHLLDLARAVVAIWSLQEQPTLGFLTFLCQARCLCCQATCNDVYHVTDRLVNERMRSLFSQTLHQSIMVTPFQRCMPSI